MKLGMVGISQLQFPPLAQLRALAKGKPCSPRACEYVFDFLAAFSVDWDKIRRQSAQTDSTSAFRLRRAKAEWREDGMPPDGVARKAVGEEIRYVFDKERFFALACAWIQKEKPDYFQTILNAVLILRELPFPDPEKSIVSLPRENGGGQFGPGRSVSLQFLRWNDRKRFVVWQTGHFQESRSLRVRGDKLDPWPLGLGEMMQALEGISPIEGFTGHWLFRPPNMPFYELWFTYPPGPDGKVRETHAGAALCAEAVALVGGGARKYAKTIAACQHNLISESERFHLHESVCKEDYRLFLPERLTGPKKG